MKNSKHERLKVLKVGDKITLCNSGQIGSIVKIHHFGTIDVVDGRGRFYRLTGIR